MSGSEPPVTHPEADLEGWVTLRVQPHDQPGVVVSPRAAQLLRSVQVFPFEVIGRSDHRFRETFTAAIPRAAPEALEHLDDDGLARIGTEVRPGHILAGRTRVNLEDEANLSEEEKLLREIFGEVDTGRDVSLRVPPGVRGRVTAAALHPPRKGEQRADVEVTVERALGVGDELEARGFGAATVVAIGDAGGADLRWGDRTGEVRVRKVSSAEDAFMARSIGPYSLVTQQPLGGKSSFGGQRVGAELVALEASGAWTCAHELLTVKSDDIDGRYRVYEGIVLGNADVQAGTPEAVAVVERELGACGFSVSTDGGWRIRFATTAEIRAGSHGEIAVPDTLNYKTLKPVDGGLFCARIFGPVVDYKCQCGKYKTRAHEGVRCGVCGVEVIASRVRRHRAGHVALPVPLVHPLVLEPLATLLGRPVEEVRGVMYSERRADGSPADDDRAATGAEAIRGWLHALDLPALAAGAGPAAELARALLHAGSTPLDWIVDAWPVLAPDLRPLVPLDGGRFATSDLNDLYRRLINRANRTRRLVELSAPGLIVVHEQRQLQQALDMLVQNGLRGRKLTGPERRPLKSLLDMLGGPEGRFATNLAHRRVDYSGVARVVPDPTVGRGALRMPHAMAEELFKPWVYHALEAAGRVTTIKAAKRLVEKRAPEAVALLEAHVLGHPVILAAGDGSGRLGGFSIASLTDGWAVALHPDDAAALELAWGDPAVVHVPISSGAIREVRALRADDAVAPGPLHTRLRPWAVTTADCGARPSRVAACVARGGLCAACAGEPVGTPFGLRAAEALDRGSADPRYLELRDREPPAGWVRRAATAATPAALGKVLVAAAVRGELDPVDDPVTRSLLGRLGVTAA